MKRYRITASSVFSDGVRTDCSNPGVLGEAYGVTWPTREAAQAVADDLQATLADYDLCESTVYTVEEVRP